MSSLPSLPHQFFSLDIMCLHPSARHLFLLSNLTLFNGQVILPVGLR